MYRKHFLPNMWESNFERLRRSDPDLFDERLHVLFAG